MAVVGTVLVVVLAGCSGEGSPPAASTSAATGRVGFCVGIDAAHPAGSRVTVVFKRGSETLGSIDSQAAILVSIAVTPGKVSITVDDVEMSVLGVGAGGTAYASSGTGCPSPPTS
ncbi:MAG TPA: hypothetical protein VFL59_11035 [Candidatus Nanopelagicales bacterium]|nr:hypothetical protein [Candidatus Nanopelagicales bacterium]